jgi:PIN domain nuclease of toxin-antitoxin system
VILDTHALIWWLRDDPRLSERARESIRDAGRALVSAASAWEIAKSQRVGKLTFRSWDPSSLPELLATAGFDVLPLSVEHGLEAGRLAGPLADPFDRILVAQCRVERLPIVSRDPVFREFGVDVIW